MQRCLQLAESGRGYVSPNPLVGAVLVHEDQIIGEGLHEYFGGSHAEVNCFNAVKEDVRHLIANSTLYVSLEPCHHFGKTPPCTHRIIEEGVRKVVIGMYDPDKRVNGRGIEYLKQQGVEIIGPVLPDECLFKTRAFITNKLHNRPYVILKWAETADRIMGSNGRNRLMITGAATNRLVHKWRAESDAILVGYKTALYDNPLLNVRHWSGKSPLRVVLDPQHALPEDLKMFKDAAPVLVLNKKTEWQNKQVQLVKLTGAFYNPVGWMQSIYNQHKGICLVEGGGATLQQFIDADLWDEIRVIRNNRLYAGSGISSPSGYNGKRIEHFLIGNDEVSIILKAPENSNHG